MPSPLAPAPRRIAAAAVLALLLVLGACATRILPPLPPQPQVDLARYAGSWFVIGAIPLSFEKKAFDPVESYHLRADGTIDVVFQYRKADFTGALETLTGNATVEPGSGNAVWGIRFLWPFRSEYRIAYLEPDYSIAIISRTARDHAWVLARHPRLAPATLDHCKARIQAMGYDTSAFFVFPQDGGRP